MPIFPRYGLPFQFYRPYNYRPRTPVPDVAPLYNKVSEEPKDFERDFQKKPKPDAPVWLDLFGIKLYFDDILILSLLFFLYEEQVKDEGLFLALVMLLIS